MITIEYTKYGTVIADELVEDVARNYCRIHEQTKQDAEYQVASGLLFDAMRLMVLEGVISYEELQFKFKGEILKVNEFGSVGKYPKGFCDVEQGILRRIVKAQSTKRRDKLKAESVED